jgi:hypothetical protein
LLCGSIAVVCSKIPAWCPVAPVQEAAAPR